MCGIAGLVRIEGAATPEDTALVSRMLTLQQKRGPDGEGLYADGPVVLGHRRLSIIDLSCDGRQPMSNETGDIWVTFNGEIYNYSELRRELKAAGHDFRSTSDTEVLVHGYEEWGWEGLLVRLRGMFALALLDARRAASSSEPFFFAARDRLGIKPFYYAQSGTRMVFASEVKALIESGAAAREPDTAALSAFLALGSIPFPRTWVKSVKCLPPGHWIAAGRDGVVVRKYWELSYESAAAADLGAMLRDSVERHLVADVPVGVFLSGGVDSAAIACLAARSRKTPVQTLTVTFDEAEFNEAAQARQFANDFGTEHHEIRVTAADFEAAIPRFLEDMDQPTADGVNTYFVSGAARRLGLKVVLSGLGGDEVFFGYGHYRRLAAGSGLLDTYAGSSLGVRRAIAGGASLYGRASGEERWQRFDYCGGRPLHESLYMLLRGFYPPAQVCRLMGVGQAELDETLEANFAPLRVFGENGHIDPNRFHFLEMKRYLHDQLLRDSDVFSMAHSIELRVPLLDDTLVEAGCHLAPRDKLDPAMNKPRLVEAADHASVRAGAMRPKQGFTFPFAAWMAAHADPFEKRALEGGMLDRDAVRDCWKKFRSGRLHWSRAWATVVLSSFS